MAENKERESTSGASVNTAEPELPTLLQEASTQTKCTSKSVSVQFRSKYSNKGNFPLLRDESKMVFVFNH